MTSDKPRILFCERNGTQREALKLFFEKRGIEVYFSEYDGRKVLQDIEQVCPHMVVLEIHIPHYDAISIKNMCSGESFCPKLFVASGCYDSNTVIEKMMDAGYDRYLLRPYAFEVLQYMMEKLFDADFSGDADMPFLEYRANEILRKLGMPRHVNGYTYLRQAIAMAVNEPLLLNSLTKELYPRIARLNDTTASRVERAMRTAVALTWERGNLREVSRFFSSGINNVWGKPANIEFIAIISDHIRAEIKKEQLMV